MERFERNEKTGTTFRTDSWQTAHLSTVNWLAQTLSFLYKQQERSGIVFNLFGISKCGILQNQYIFDLSCKALNFGSWFADNLGQFSPTICTKSRVKYKVYIRQTVWPLTVWSGITKVWVTHSLKTHLYHNSEQWFNTLIPRPSTVGRAAYTVVRFGHAWVRPWSY